MPLDAEEYGKLRELYFEVVELAPDARRTFLDAQGDIDPSILHALEQLLAHSTDSTIDVHEVMRQDRENDPIASTADDQSSHDSRVQLPERIGSYRVVRRLGEGGMGTVYEAQQENPSRRVALKVLKRELSSPKLAIRFEHESQILGLLQHPGIAQIYHAGTADLGYGPRPYFVMELIRGSNLLEFAQAENLSIAQRLALFTSIAQAVHHAHQKGVIHRDLKPENILVTDDGQPKVLDFGVAHVADADIRTTSATTEPGLLVGTVDYMSPEQAMGSPGEIDIRTDVHSLGVMLFQLLTHRLPYETQGKMLHEALRAIREDEPIRAGAVDPLLRGDVDTIIAKALEKQCERRYQSALDLAADIEHYLNHRPIMARPPSALYQLRKYAQRYRGVFTAAAVALLMLVVGVAGTTYGLVQANRRAREARQAEQQSRRAQNEAERSRDEADAVVSYLATMLSSANPDTLGRDVMVRDVLDRAAASIPRKFADQPLVEALLRQVIGLSYCSLGHYDLAEPHLVAAATIRRAQLGERNPLTVESVSHLATALIALGKFKEAGDMHRRNYELARRVLGEDDPKTLDAKHALAISLVESGSIDEAVAIHREILHWRTTNLGPEDLKTLDSMDQLALALVKQGKNDDAVELLRKSLEIRTRVLGPEHSRTLTTMNYLAAALDDMGQDQEAQALLENAIDISRRVLGDEHPHTLDSMRSLATVHYHHAHFRKAEAIYREVLEIQRRVLGDEHPATLNTWNNLADVYHEQGQYRQAEKLYRRMFDTRRRALGERHPDTLISLHNLGVTLCDLGRYDEAERTMRSAYEARKSVLGDEHPFVLSSMNALARIAAVRGRLTEARELSERVLESRQRVLGAEHRLTLVTMRDLARLLLLQGQPDEAEALFRKTISIDQRVLGKTHSEIAYALTGLAETLLALCRPNEAKNVVQEALDIRLQTFGEDHPDIAHSRSVLGECLTALGQYEKAKPLLLASYERLRAVQGDGGHETIKALRRIRDFCDVTGDEELASQYNALRPESLSDRSPTKLAPAPN